MLAFTIVSASRNRCRAVAIVSAHVRKGEELLCFHMHATRGGGI